MTENATKFEKIPEKTVNFDFQHKVFSTAGCTFRKAADGSGVAMYVSLGDVSGSVPINGICTTFSIAPGSSDDLLLKRVGQALRIVKEVHPGDSIPSEVIDGTASWMVEERFLSTAKARITLQLIAWLRGQHLGEVAPDELLVQAEAPAARQAVQEAFSAIAEKLGYGPEKREEVVNLIDRIARELSYIEALRDRLTRLQRMSSMLRTLHGTYARERQTQEIIDRCSILLSKPIRAIMAKFAAVDANTGEVLQTLRKFDAQVAYIRKVRDELRETYLLWEDLLAIWDDCDGTQSPAAEKAVREAYRFSARHFSQATTWGSAAA
jgi:hypothetical protein